ncbi:LPS export ABC transporter permease LptF [Pseudohalocynthiibacter aestuariivivens]|uniref:LPS export ABC transporter permease LptF n=1 Tax=Pseudohalocynthiibacter aestuariivivens TaxID=1591409 RepID=A0ABV5JKM4_9RHOB|nr:MULTISPECIES: LPS export ABC transporter permease LptF [Pseudohalocynthiibacter]MBS9716533.1 LPS export ABC transporter permease LptF [Pseudohalocynthiibacter aestuariivivens]MCK0101602.1 LPS export ABC transporter permease LptF [Pseudohalocynthiibacter sp. F2068]
MARFDRYMLSQLMVLFGFFSLVLVMVYWINRAVVLFDQLIADGQSATVFLEFTALTLPRVVRVVLPISAFAASVYVTNRLSTESELVVMQSSGYSGYRLARPVLFFGIVVALMMSVLMHFLVPSSLRALHERRAEISQNVTARFLKEGMFLHPADGITFYIREISPAGELRHIFLSDVRNADSPVTYTAKRALLVRDPSGPKLLMFDGLAQNFTPDSQRLATTSFADFAYDIGSLIEEKSTTSSNPELLSTYQLLNASDEFLESIGIRRAHFLYEAHFRFAQPLLAIVTALVGFSCLMLGGFNRFGFWRQIVGAIVLLIFIKTLDNALNEIAQNNENYWFLVYVSVLTGILISYLMLWISSKPMLFKRRRKVTA